MTAARKLRHLFLGKKSVTHLDSILSRDHFAHQVSYSQNLFFFSTVVMYRCESWTIKEAEELMLLNGGVGEDSVPSAARRTRQSIL